MESTQHHPPSAEALKKGYEEEGVSVRWLTIFVACFVATGVVLHVLVWFLLRGDLAREHRGEAPVSAVPRLNQPAPDVPLLQPSGQAHDTLPQEDLAAMHARENLVFEHLGWKVNAEGIAQIPEAALKVVQSRGKGSPP